jgi:hypothetical protein
MAVEDKEHGVAATRAPAEGGSGLNTPDPRFAWVPRSSLAKGPG